MRLANRGPVLAYTAFGEVLETLMQFKGRFWKMKDAEVAQVLRAALAHIS